jgi:hypothetical protein
LIQLACRSADLNGITHPPCADQPKLHRRRAKRIDRQGCAGHGPDVLRRRVSSARSRRTLRRSCKTGLEMKGRGEVPRRTKDARGDVQLRSVHATSFPASSCKPEHPCPESATKLLRPQVSHLIDSMRTVPKRGRHTVTSACDQHGDESTAALRAAPLRCRLVAR